ncbi:type VII secretion system-associated protein [Streptomyces sp. NPDC005423]|uniref:type VII secretion system-associated protein n=1 Tax=Streptomyces sp. NPDC005423 TaxID=3155343 RepID=UPI0033A57AC4
MTNNAAPAEDAALPQDGLPAPLAPPGPTPQDPSPDPAEAPGEPEDTRPPVLSRPVTADDLAQGDHETGDNPEIAGAMPPPPRHVVEAAEDTPGHWFALADPAWTGAWPPPAWTVVGEWRADDLGQLVEWRHNPDYVRSPAARGWSRPTDAIDAAVQRAAAGYGQDDEVPELLAGAEVAVLVGPGGEPVAAVAPDGTPVVLAFTSEAHLTNAGRLAYEILDVPALADRLPEGHQIYLNASASVSMCVEPEALARAIERARQETDAPGAGEQEPAAEPDGGLDAGLGEGLSEGPDEQPETKPEDRPEPEGGPESVPDEVIAAATRVDTSGSTPASALAPASAATALDPETRSDGTPEPSDVPAPVPAPAPATPTLAESAAAALMATADH